MGPFETNCYVLTHGCESLVVDPGDDIGRLLLAIRGTELRAVILTHGHADHHGALTALVAATGAPVMAHESDSGLLPLRPDIALYHAQEICVGPVRLAVSHVPGHTPGSVVLGLNDGHMLVGDSVFAGGPGHTETPADLALLIKSLMSHVFSCGDDTVLFPGHGGATTVGQERRGFDNLVRSGWPPGLCGDVTWADARR